MDDRQRDEADLYRRYEARIVRLELRVDDLEAFEAKYAPIVDTLREAQLVAVALVAKADLARRGVLPKWQIVIAVLALFVPSILTATLTFLILKR